jgi:hypothetical protein
VFSPHSVLSLVFWRSLLGVGALPVPAARTTTGTTSEHRDPERLLCDLILKAFNDFEFDKLVRDGPRNGEEKFHPPPNTALDVVVDLYLSWCHRRDLLQDLCKAIRRERPRREREVDEVERMIRR